MHIKGSSNSSIMINFIDQKKPISTECKYYGYNAFIRSKRLRIESYYSIIQLPSYKSYIIIIVVALQYN